MAFIGNTNTTQAFTPAIDYFSGNGSTTAFTLSRPVASVAQVQVVVNNVAQNPSSAYTVSGNTITFTSAPSSGTNNIYVYYTSPITQVIAPSQGTVGTTQLQNGLTVNFADGTAAAPSITNDGDTNTGVFYPAADTVGVSTGGSERLRVDSSGNVGIGQTSQVWDEKLGVRPSGTSTVGIGVYSSSASYTGSLIRVQSENSTGTAYKLYEGRGAGGAVNYWVDGTGGAYFAGNLQFNSGYGSVATAYGCRAWVNFNGTGTVSIRASGNVTSITDNGVGSYAVNLTNAMPDTNYACVMATKGSSGAGTPFLPLEHASLAARTTSSIAFYVIALNGATPDADVVEVAFFR